MSKTREPSAAKQPRVSTDARTTAAFILWGFGTALAFVGNWLHWEWLAKRAPVPYPNQVWGDIASSQVENGLLIAYLVLGVLMLVFWRLSGNTSRPSPDHRRRILFARVGTVVKWVTVAVAGTALIAIAWLLGLYLKSWWLMFPGWLGQWFASLCILVGALLLPSFQGPHRMHERERQRRATLWAALFAVCALLLPIPIGKAVTLTQVTFSAPGVERASTDIQIEEFFVDKPWGRAGLIATSSGQPVWERTWRGAREPKLFPSLGGQTAAVALLQATLTRSSLVLVGSDGGKIISQMTPGMLDWYGIDLAVEPDHDRLVFTYANNLLRSGNGKEWISAQGTRYESGPPTSYVEQAAAKMIPTDGVHALDMVTKQTWFIGDGSGCARRVAVSDGRPVIGSDGVLVMVQICDSHARVSPWWSFPSDLVQTIAPLTATVFGVDAGSGSITWTQPLPGFEEWVGAQGLRYPSAEYWKIPLQWDSSGEAAEVTMGEVTTRFDPNTGEPQ